MVSEASDFVNDIIHGIIEVDSHSSTKAKDGFTRNSDKTRKFRLLQIVVAC